MSELTTFRCPCCGGEITYSIAQQKLTCSYCDTSFDIETLQSYEKEMQQSFKNHMEWDDNNHDLLDDQDYAVYICEQCGGQIITEKQTIASTCPYCHSPVVFNNNVQGQFQPNYIIPFQIDKENAIAQFENYLAMQTFFPHLLKQKETIQNIKGIYVPFWTYHCVADAKYQYRIEKKHYYSDIDYDYTKTEHYLAVREGNVEFENVPVDGSSKIDNKMMQSIEPFDFNHAVPFQKAYLAGHFADKYDIDAKTCENEANKRIQATVQNIFNDTVNDCHLKHLTQSQIILKNKKNDYYLLPVWVLSLTWQDKQYILMMNGQTGKIAGEMPIDIKAFMKSVFLYAIVITFFVFLILSGLE